MVTKDYIKEKRLREGARIEVDFGDWLALHPKDEKIYTLVGYFNRKKSLNSESNHIVLDELVVRTLDKETGKERLDLIKDLNNREYQKKIPFQYIKEIRKLKTKK